MILPHEAGSRAMQVKFRKQEDLPAVSFDPVVKEVAGGLPGIEGDSSQTSSETEAT